MSAPDPLRYWQDTDDPNWSDETEARFIQELGAWNVENALRPRDAYDVDVHPETFRGHVLAYYDALDAAVTTLRSTRRGRFVLWLASLRSKRKG